MNEPHKTQNIKPEPTDSQQIGMDSTANSVVSFLTNAPRQSIVSRFLVMLASVVVVGYGVSAASKIVGPIFLALFLAIILHVPLQWMQKKGCPKLIALIIVIVSTVIIFVGISYHVAKSLNYLVAKSPEYKANLEAKIAAIDKRLERIGIAITGLTAWQLKMENKNGNGNEDEDEIENVENIGNNGANGVDKINSEIPVDKNSSPNNRYNNSDKIVLPPNNTPHLETPSNDVKSNNNLINLNSAANPQKPPTKTATVAPKPAPANKNTNNINNRNVNSGRNETDKVDKVVDKDTNKDAEKDASKIADKDSDKNAGKDSGKDSEGVESGKVVVVAEGVNEANDLEGAANVAKVTGTVEGDVPDKTDGNIRNKEPVEGEGNDLETTSLSEFLGGSKVGFGFLKDDADKLHKESVKRPRHDSQSNEKSQLILLNSRDVMVWLRTSLIAIREIGESAFLVLIFTIFMVFEAASFPTKIDRAFGFDGPINNQRLQHIAGEIRRYLFLKAISSMMSAVAATAVYWFFGVPAMFFWGVVAFFLYFIPNVGGILASIIPGLLIFMTHDWQGVAVYAICLVCIECTIGYGIEPKMLGHGLGISTVVILLSLFTWGMLLGPIGLFMAAPLTIMVKITLQAFKETEWIATLIDRK